MEPIVLPTEEKMRAANLTRVAIVTAMLGTCTAWMAWMQIPPLSHAKNALLQSSMDFSSAAKQKRTRPAPPAAGYRPHPHFGGPADPSFGPDGKPYRVPEYLRNQCYIDDGYGRFSACSSRT
jgi:hypothetical protein